ncbi:chloride channel protein [Desulfurobacterium pacificum]|nr:chloride channel protein [Desulfurobacterium pacificum]
MIKERLNIRKIMLLSVPVGIAAGIFTVLFLKALDFSTHVFLEQLVGYIPPKPSGEGGRLPYLYSPENIYLLPFVTALGGLITGLLIYFLSPESAGIGTDAAIRAFHKGLPLGFKTAILKLVTSAITIGSGGASGREGPMALIGASVGKGIAKLFKLSPKEQNILLAAGLGAGIGAVFRAPFAGGILSAEVFYKEDFEVEALIPGFLASIIAYIVAGSFIGFQTLFNISLHKLTFSQEIIAGYVILGIVSAVVAKLLINIFYKVEDYFKNIKVPDYIKPAIGGFVVGICGIITPLAIGNGYGWIQMLMNDNMSFFSPFKLFISIFLVILALSFTLGSGGSGGVFGPSLVIGGITGAWLSTFFNSILGAKVFQISSMTMVGMISVFTAAASAPLSTIVLVAEMTRGYDLLPLAIISIVVAYVLAGNEKTIFKSQVKSRLQSPVHQDELKVHLLEIAKVKDVMTKNVITISPEEPAIKAREIMAEKFIAGLPVVVNGVVVGIVTTSDILKLNPEELEHVKVREIMTPQPNCVLPDWTLLETLQLFISRGYGRAPVVKDFESMKLVGIISRSDISRYMIKRSIVE